MSDPAHHGHAHDVLKMFEPAFKAGEARNPVCGMTVNVATAKHHAEHDGKIYHFCSGR